MKNLLLLILLCFFLTNFSASAQTSKGSVGLVGSGDFYNFEFNPDLKTGGMYDGIFNYSLGLEGSYRFTDYFSGSLGLLGAKKKASKRSIFPMLSIRTMAKPYAPPGWIFITSMFRFCLITIFTSTVRCRHLYRVA